MATLKPIFLHETIKTPLRRLNESADSTDKYVLTGPCAWFDEMNDNGRIYDKDDYMQQIERLQNEIELGLHGEIEHTDDSEPKIDTASHCIKKLWYDEAQGCVMITIQLLNSEQGKKLMAMVDADMPIYISSRAAGFIDEDTSKVSLDEIYTYDVVRRPGFKNAKLNPVNESKILNGKSDKSDISIYYNENKKINNQKDEMKDFVTKEELKLFTDNLQRSMNALKLAIKENNSLSGKTDFSGKTKINEKRKVNEDDESGEKLTDIATYLDDVTQVVNKHTEQLDDTNIGVQYSELIAKQVNLQGEYLQLLADRVNGVLAYIKNTITNPLNVPDEKIQELTTELATVSEYAEHIAKKVNLQETKLTKTAATVEKVKAESKFIGEQYDKINIGTKRMQRILEAKKLNESAMKVEKIDSTVSNKILSTIKEVGGKLLDSAKTAELTKELQAGGNASVQGTISKYVGADVAKKVMDAMLKDGYDFSGEKATNERKQPFAKGELTKNIDKVLESIKKKRIDEGKSVDAIKYPFMNLVDAQVKTIFESLSDIKKQKISQVITEKKVTRRQEITDVIQQISEERGFINILAGMPRNLLPLWENCGQQKREQIARLSSLKELRNDDEIVDFWSNVDFGVIRRQKIDESLKFGEQDVTLVDNLGYSDEEVAEMFK